MITAASPCPSILIVSNMWPSEDHPVFGGFVARNAEALRDVGADVEVVANCDPRTGWLASAIKYARFSRRVRRYARARRFDAVVGHYLYPTAAIAHTASRITGAKLVLVVHGTDSRSVRRKDPWAFAARQALKSADLVITVSDSLAGTVRHDLALPGHIPIKSVHMGIDGRVFVPDPSARPVLGVNSDERLVLYVGSLVRPKGLDVLQAAFEALVARGAADRLVIVGAGPLDTELREWVEGNAVVRDRVTLTGTVEQATVARWMAAADVLTLPSRNEGLGLVLLEAMACGTPCVASRVGGVPEILDEATGELVPPDDPHALARAIESVITRGRDSYREACLSAAVGQDARGKAAEMFEAIGQILPQVSITEHEG